MAHATETPIAPWGILFFWFRYIHRPTHIVFPDAETTDQISHKHEARHPKCDKTALTCQVWFTGHSLSTLRHAFAICVSSNCWNKNTTVNSVISFTCRTDTKKQSVVLAWESEQTAIDVTAGIFLWPGGQDQGLKWRFQSILFLCFDTWLGLVSLESRGSSTKKLFSCQWTWLNPVSLKQTTQH